jgi:hypothetical protein
MASSDWDSFPDAPSAKKDDWSSFADAAPSTEKPLLQSATDKLRFFNDILTMGGWDKLQAAAKAAVNQKSYADLLAQERARTAEAQKGLGTAEEIALRTAGIAPLMLGGGLFGVAARGAEALAPATAATQMVRAAASPTTTTGRIGAGAAEAGLTSAAEAAGRDYNIPEAMTTGMLLGGGVSGLGSLASRNVTPPAAATLRNQANEAYDTARQAGVRIGQNRIDDLVQNVTRVADDFGLDPVLQPRATRALNRIQELTGQNVDLVDLDTVRKVAQTAARSQDPSDRAASAMIVSELDNFVNRLRPNDVVAGNAREGIDAFNQARQLWGRQAKANVVDELIDRAATRAGQFSGSGYENALRTEFRQLAMNRNRMRGFTEQERNAIRRVAEGGPLENAARYLGKLAPTGVVSGGISGSAGYAAGGPLGVAAMYGAGLAGRQAATSMTAANAERASELMRAGRAGIQRRQLTPEEMMYLRAASNYGIMQGNADAAMQQGGLLGQ